MKTTKFAWTFLLMLLHTAIIYGQGRTYQVYSYQDMGFQIAFPNPPTIEQKQGKYMTWQYRAKNKNTAYCVVVTQLDKSLNTKQQKDMAETIFQVLAQHGEVQSSSPYSSANGMSAKFINAEKVYVQCEIHIYQNRIYQLLVLSDNSFLQDRRIQNYFESFSVL